MQFNKVIINATSHSLHVYDESGTRVALELPRNDADPIAAHAEPRRFRSKEDLGRLYEQGPDQFPWTAYTLYGLANVLFTRGLISKEEMDLAERDFGDAWKAHTSPASANPRSTPNLEDQNPTTLTLEQAKELLRRAYRYESRDSAFGDSEVSWYERELTDGNDHEPIADGYFSRDGDSVGITLPGGETVEFTGRDASELFQCGNGLGAVGENSSMPRTHLPI